MDDTEKSIRNKIICKSKNFYNKFKEKKYKILLSILQSLNRYCINLAKDKDIEKDNPYKYEDLMPKCDVVKNKQYCETIDWALKNYKIRNIALTGVYGSGKSTILKTYQTLHKEYNYLNISMATFNDGMEKSQIGDETEKVYIDNAVIEKGILQQIFYKVKYKLIPCSRFKRIKDYKFSYILLESCILVVTIFGGIILFKPKVITELKNNIDNIAKIFNVNSKFVYIGVGILFILMIKILTPLIKCFRNGFKITKISTKAGDAQFDDSEKSIFNKYIDEILYFFEATKYDVVIFEDLDRFNNIEIFSKLRELNLLINNCEQINRRVVFIYAIKDDMFCNEKNKDDKFHYKNRTKFFDFIIPVVQVANSANACNLMIRKFTDANLLGELNAEFISDISFLINDMRVLNNIFNEYVIYKENLKRIDNKKQKNNDEENNKYENKLDPIKLLSIIIYKNMYPVDFSKLQDDEGMVYELFNNKEKLIESRIKQLNEEIKNIEIKIYYEKKECIERISELRIVYANYILKVINRNSINIKGQKYNSEKLSSESAFELFLNMKKSDFTNYPNYFNENDFNKLKEKKEEYLKREKVIKSREKNVKSNVLEYLKKELEDKHKKVNTLNLYPLKELINDDNVNEFFKGDIADADLLKFLIKKGYIDEDYSEYISYFYEGIITSRDNEFIHNAMYEKEMSFQRPIDKPKNVINKLHEYMFNEKYILNYNLLDFIIENKEENTKYQTCYELIIEQLSNESITSFLFVEGYVGRKKNIKVFLKSLCNKWSNMWIYIETKANFTKEKLDFYLKYIIKFANIRDIKNMDTELILTNYISQLPYFLNLISEHNYFNKIERLIKILDIKFSYIERGKYQRRLLDFVYKNNRYDINEYLIELIVETYSDKTSNELRKSNYTTIINSKCEYLKDYIDSEINKYIENVFLELKTNTEESEETVIYLLKNKDISEENKYSIIKKEKVIIWDINSVNKKLWDNLILNKKITIDWFNIIIYYREIGEINEILADCLNEKENYIKLGNLKMDDNDDFGDDILNELSLELIKSNNIKEEAFNELLKSIPFKYEDLGVDSLSYNRINTMIKNNNLILTVDNYNLVKEHYNSNLVLLIIYNINIYLDNRQKYELNSKQINELLDSSIRIEDKIFIIEGFNNIPDGDIQLISKIIDYTLNNEIHINEDVLVEILQSEIKQEEKVKLLTSQIDNLDKNNISRLLNILGGPYVGIAKIRKRPTLKANDVNEQLVKKLDNNGYISSFSLGKGILKVNTHKK